MLYNNNSKKNKYSKMYVEVVDMENRYTPITLYEVIWHLNTAFNCTAVTKEDTIAFVNTIRLNC